MHQRPVQSRQPRLRLLAIAAALSIGPAVAFAQASGATVIHGQASVNAQGNHLTVTTSNGAGTRHSAINWQSFSVPVGGTARFNQPDSASTSINRVLGSDPSRIFGTLSSNGRLVLVNPSGITVGAGAVVDTAGFTASTLRMSDADALAGRMRFEGGSAASALQVDGSVLARGGDVVLISPNGIVGAGAVVRAPDGAVVLAAGRSVEITGRGLEGIRMQVVAPTDSAVNLGALEGDAVGMFAGSLRHSGFINASGAELDGGKLRLVGTHSSQVDGVVRAGGVRLALATTMKEGKGKDGDKEEKEEKDKADKEKADKEKAEKEARDKADKDEADKEAKAKADKDKADREAKGKAKPGGGNWASENGGAGNGGVDEVAPAAAANPAGGAGGANSASAPAPAPAPAPTAAAPSPEPAPAAGPQPSAAAAPPSPGSTITITQGDRAPSSQQAGVTTLALKELVTAVRAPQMETVRYLSEAVASASTPAADIRKKTRKDEAADEALQCVP